MTALLLAVAVAAGGDTKGVVVISYDEIPGIGIVQYLGRAILGLAFTFLVLQEVVRFFRVREIHLSEPFLRVLAGLVTISFVPTIGGWMVEVVTAVSGAMQEKSNLELFGKAVSVAMGQDACDAGGLLATVKLLFTVKGWMAMGGSALYVIMYVLKFLIIDILWPVLFGLVVFLGVLSVPIGVLPGIGTMSGWVKNMIEIGLWPVVFQFLMALVAAMFPKTLEAMVGGNVTLDCGIQTAVGRPLTEIDHTVILQVLQFMAMCGAYVVLILFTPFVTAMVVRAAPVGIIGGIVAAKAISMVQNAVGAVGTAAKVAVTGGAGGAGAAGGAAGGGGAASPAERLDQRPPGGG